LLSSKNVMADLTSDSHLGDIFDAMDQPSSPIARAPSASSKKHHRPYNSDDNSEESGDEGDPGNARPSNQTPATSTMSINPNIAVTTKRYATKKKLHSEQTTELDVFLNVSGTSLFYWTFDFRYY
jgi:hypothetical protein